MEDSPASSHSPSPCAGGSGLVEAGSGATGGRAYGNFPNIYHYTSQEIKPVITLPWHWAGDGAAWMVGESIYLHPSLTPVLCISQEQPQGPQELLSTLVPPKQGRQHMNLGRGPHTPSCSLWDKEKNHHHLPVTEKHSRSTQEKRGWAPTAGWLTGQPWRGPTFPLQHKSPAAPHQELQHEVCLLQTLLRWHQQEPLTWFQPGLHPVLIRSCS